MNQTMETILNRRSTRTFGEGQISQEAVDLIIKAGLFAPSAHNQQPWHFTVIQNQALLQEINDASKEGARHHEDPQIARMGSNESFNVFYHAPTAIIISGKDDGMMPTTDCAAATQNMLLAAESLNIGGCWLGLVNFALAGPKEAHFRKNLNIPEGFTPYYGIALGHKKNDSTKPPKRREGTVTFIG